MDEKGNQGKLERFREQFDALKANIGRVILGQEALIEDLLVAVLAGGHVLLEGAPGLGKTRLVRSFAQATDMSFGRIQFTPDLMPADVTGTTVFNEERSEERRVGKEGRARGRRCDYEEATDISSEHVRV